MVFAIKNYLFYNGDKFKYLFFGIFLTLISIFLYKYIENIVNILKDNNTLKDKLKKIITNKHLMAIIALIVPVILKLLLYGYYFTIDMYIHYIYTYAFCFTIYLYKLLSKKSEKISKCLNIIVKHRYKIAIAVFFILVLMNVNFSSIGMWNRFIGEGVDSTILGTPREIRSDEWLVTTPFILSQQYNGFKLVNDNVAIGNNDMNIFHGPVLDASFPVRVFNWGYFLFGNERGMSWAWVLKFIVMFMVFFEFGMIITKNNKLLSLLISIWISFSPYIVWWSVLEIPTYAVAIIVLFHTYMANKNLSLKKKLLIAYGMIVFLCNYFYALYPAWQVPFGYFVLAFIIVDFIKYRKNLNRKDYIIMGITLLITLGIVGYFIITSWDGINAIISTKYPGAREETGGVYPFTRLINYYTNFFTPYSTKYANSSDLAAFIYPTISVLIVILTSIIYVIKNKKIKETLKNKENWYIYAVLTIIIICLLWMCFKWPAFLRKITLIYNSPMIRIETVFEFSCVILTILLASKMFNRKEKLIKAKVAFIISSAITILTYFVIINSNYAETFTTFKFEVILPIIFLMNYTFLSSNKKAFTCTMVIISIFVGATVNPICIGINPITKTEIAQTAIKIAKENPDAIWAGESQLNAQYLIANGIKAINGINEYPNYDWINKLDPEHKYEEVWNRYAHIILLLDEGPTFELQQEDVYILHLNYNDLKNLNIKYYYTKNEISDIMMQEFSMNLIYENKDTNNYIYEIN